MITFELGRRNALAEIRQFHRPPCAALHTMVRAPLNLENTLGQIEADRANIDNGWLSWLVVA